MGRGRHTVLVVTAVLGALTTGHALAAPPAFTPAWRPWDSPPTATQTTTIAVPSVVSPPAPVEPAPTPQKAAIAARPSRTRPAPRIAIAAAEPAPWLYVTGAGGQTLGEPGAAIEAKADDPARLLASRAARTLASRKGGVMLDAPVSLPARPLLREEAPADYIVEVTTDYWDVSAFLLDPSRFGVNYAATWKVYAPDSRTPMATGVCQVARKRVPTSPTLDELTADGMARLKSMLADAGDACFTQMTERLAAL